MLLPATLLAVALASTSFKLESPPVPPGAVLTRSSPNEQVGLTIGLEMRDPQVLDQLIARQHDPASPLYHRWITPQEFADRFGQPVPAYEAMVGQLAAFGFQVDRYADRILIHALGNVAQAEKLLGVTFYDVAYDDTVFRTFRGSGHLPPALAASAIGIAGLDTRAHFKHRLVDSFGDITMGPQDLRRLYDMSALHTLGIAGQLSAVGIVGPIPNPTSFPVPANLDWFYGNVSNSSVQFDLVNLGLQGSQPDPQNDEDELELDAEMSTVAAPLEQSITMVLAPADQLFVQGFAYFVNEMPGITAVSTSYGNCELAQLQGEELGETTPNEHVIDANLIAQGTAEGIAFFAASGDSGTDDCQQPDAGATVDFPASIPYMVAAGGTQYAGTELDMLTYVTAYHPGDETTWDSLPSGGAGGGGTSIIYPKPSYQIGIGDSAHFRDMPDLALVASPDPGVAVDLSSPGVLEPIGGTSDAAPMAAGIFALINDAIGGCRVGAPQFEMYKLGVAQFDAGGAEVFHDITVGSISQDGIYPDAGAPVAKVGFDDASGWGSLDVTAIANAWPPCPPTGAPSGPLFLDDGGLPLNDAGYYYPGPFDPGAFDGGPGFDAGHTPYDPCEVIACDAGSVCVGSDAGGPYACITYCTPTQTPSPCVAGTFCDSTSGTCQFGCLTESDCPAQTTCIGATPADGGPGSCDQDCDPTAADAGCVGGTFCRTSTDTCGTTCDVNADCPTGKACEACFGRCTTERDGGPIGAPCTNSGECATAERCLGPEQGFPDGYCSPRCEAASGVCGCPTDAVCLLNIYNPDAGVAGEFAQCLAQCVIGDDSTCSNGNVCDAIGLGNAPGDVGGCLPPCAANSICNTDPEQTACDPVSGDCVIPEPDGGIPTTAASSGSSGISSGASTGSTASTSSGASTSGALSTGAAGSSGTSSGSSGATVSATSSTGTSGTSTSGTSGTSGSTHGATSSGTTSSTGGSSSSGSAKSGCGCTSGADSESAVTILLGLAALAVRRRRR